MPCAVVCCCFSFSFLLHTYSDVFFKHFFLAFLCFLCICWVTVQTVPHCSMRGLGQFGRPLCSRPRLQGGPKKIEHHLCAAFMFLFFFLVAPRAGSPRSSGLIMCLPILLLSKGYLNSTMGPSLRKLKVIWCIGPRVKAFDGLSRF